MKRAKRLPGLDKKHSTGRAKKRPKVFQGRKSRSSKEDMNISSTDFDQKISLVYEASSFDGYRLFDINNLFKTLQSHLSCKECGGSIILSEVSLKGLAGTYSISCQKCVQAKIFSSSKTVDNSSNDYEINRRSVLAMRCIGQGLESLATFCGIMDLPSPVKRFTYNKIVKHMVTATSTVANAVLEQAVNEEINLSDVPDAREINVQCDTTWQKRGYKSVNGVCTVVGSRTEKILDLEVLSSECTMCEPWKGRQTGEKWLTWYRQHKPDCPANHTRSSMGMEENGLEELSHRSMQTRNIKYVRCSSNADTQAQPYELNIKAEPLELDVGADFCETDFKAEPCGLCIKTEPCKSNFTEESYAPVDKIEKRFGEELRELKSRLRGKNISDGKRLAGSGRLTNAVIDEMETYYENAVCSNSGSIDDTNKAIWGIWFHKCSTDEKPRHDLCPRGKDSWCQYNNMVEAAAEESYKHRNSLPMSIMHAIRPVFEKLTNQKMPICYSQEKKQKVKEDVNSIIWKICPKQLYTGRSLVQISANIGVITSSQGAQGIVKIMSELGIDPGVNAVARVIQLEQMRLKQDATKSLNKV